MADYLAQLQVSNILHQDGPGLNLAFDFMLLSNLGLCLRHRILLTSYTLKISRVL